MLKKQKKMEEFQEGGNNIVQSFVSNDPRLIAFLKQKSHKLIFINKLMIHEQQNVLFFHS